VQAILPRLNGGAAIGEIAFHQEAVEALGCGNVASVLRQLRPLK
jgi:hypothetical protein